MGERSLLLSFYRDKIDCKQFQSQVIIGEKSFKESSTSLWYTR
ncbi:Uncharacterised protein [Legionella cincinnatiensis]|uniref:Uncharacterized protein n=1 Tax=Legionella cincinnatiensis TaxID=28085 RepID=A0A378INP6_9GAMM|nr:Uncharacterised protein [Legionella cincinnatiensis]